MDNGVHCLHLVHEPATALIHDIQQFVNVDITVGGRRVLECRFIPGEMPPPADPETDHLFDERYFTDLPEAAAIVAAGGSVEGHAALQVMARNADRARRPRHNVLVLQGYFDGCVWRCWSAAPTLLPLDSDGVDLEPAELALALVGAVAVAAAHPAARGDALPHWGRDLQW